MFLECNHDYDLCETLPAAVVVPQEVTQQVCPRILRWWVMTKEKKILPPRNWKVPAKLGWEVDFQFGHSLTQAMGPGWPGVEPKLLPCWR